MRLTLEATGPSPRGKTEDRKIVLEEAGDDLDIDEIAELIRHALLAWGYHPETVAAVFGLDASEG